MSISIIFLLFPILIGVISFLKNKRNQLIFATLILIFVIAFSANGADYFNYQSIYQLVADGYSFDEIHSEFLFLALNWIFSKFGLSYEVFKVVLLCVTISVASYYIFKLSNNYCFSMFLFYCAYLLYITTIYRQFAVMGMVLAAFYCYFIRNKQLLAFAILSIGCFIHISAIFPLGIFLLYKVKFFRFEVVRPFEALIKNQVIINKEQRYAIYLLILAFMSRIVIYSFSDKITEILIARGQYYSDFNFFSVGFLSRAIPCLVFIYYHRIFCKNRMIYTMYLFYLSSILLYIAVPYELVITRLALNFKLFEVILAPYLISQLKKDKLLVVSFFVAYGISVLLYQLMNQVGYFPYVNILFS